MVFEQKFSWNCFENNSIFVYLSPTSSHFHPIQVEHCDSNSRLVVNENDNCKFRLERVYLCFPNFGEKNLLYKNTTSTVALSGVLDPSM